MGISHDIISEFVKITNDKKEKPKEETVYATIVQASDGKYVKIDGSDLITPTETTTDIEEGERVTVLIKDHSAIITGNITSPSASVNRVNGIVDVVNEKLGVFEHIVADKIDVNELNAYKATIEHLIVGKAEIEDLKATRAEIEFLDADVAHIKTLVNGNLTSDNILSFNITADKVTMADAFIKDAMVDTINAAKINAGRINTNNVVIGSDDGGMLISGATQQFTDKNGKVRIQIGRDSTGDFTFVLYGEDGTGQIINQNGITASAVSDGLIVNDMINNNAAISGGKLDISSVIFEINNENDTAIHSSKIYLDEQNQSLEAAFNSLKTQVDTIVDVSIDGDLKAFTEQIQSNTAKIEMNKSSINTLVSEDAIIRKEVSDLEGNLIETTNTLSSKYTSLKQSMDGFKLEAADVYAKKTSVEDLENNLTTNYTTTEAMNSAITQKADEITSTVSRIETSMAIDNLLANGNFTNGLNNWTYISNGYDINYSVSTNTYWTMAGKTALLLQCSNHPQGIDSGFTQVVNVKRNTDYTFTGYIASHRAEGLAIIKDAADNWLTFDKTNPDGEDYTGTYDITKWKRIRFVINSGERDELRLHLAMGTSRENGHVWFHDFMVTEGNTDLCWKPSERETRTQINQLSDRITATVSSVEMVNGKVNQAQSQIDQQANQILSTVSYIDDVDGKVNQAQSQIDQQAQQILSTVSYIDDVDGKVNRANSQIDQQAQQILSTVSYIDDVDGKVNRAQSQINQLSDSITSEVVKIEKSMAIDNLLANGNFTNGLNNWTYISNGYDINYSVSTNTYWTMAGKTALLLSQSYHPQGIDSGFTQIIDVKRNTNYTFTGYIASHRAEGLVVIKDDAGNWLTFDKTDPYSEEYTGTDDISKWKRIRLVYYSGERDQLQLHLAIGTSNENGNVWFHDFMVTEGDTDLCWKPSERETRTQINQLSDRITATVSSVEMVNGKVNQAQSQIDQQANQIASKVNSGDLSSLIQQNSSSIYAAISNGRGVNGVGIDTSGLYLHNNNLVTARLTEGKFHAYNSWNGKHMGYFGTNGDDLRACLYDTNTFSVYSNDTALLFKARYERDASYGNATLDMCGGINFIHKPGQDVGFNQILLGNDDRADIYGYHNLSIRAHNSLGFMDNNGLTNMFFATRTGSIVMKGTVYQNSQSGISTFSLLRSREVVNDYGYTTEDMVNSILTLETSVNVDENEDYSMRICSSENELVTKILGDSLHIDQGSVIAGLVETVKSLNNRILELESELKK